MAHIVVVSSAVVTSSVVTGVSNVLINGGHVVDYITDSAVTLVALKNYDLIISVNHRSNLPLLKEAVSFGIPVICGVSKDRTPTAPTTLGLFSGPETWESAHNYTKPLKIDSIMSGLKKSVQYVYTAKTFCSGYPITAMAAAGMTLSALYSNRDDIINIAQFEVGSQNVLGETLGARCLLLGAIYGAEYTIDGAGLVLNGVDWCLSKYKTMKGIIVDQDDAIFGNKLVRVYEKDTGLIASETTSDTNGEFKCEVKSGRYYAIAFDEATERNATIYDHIEVK